MANEKRLIDRNEIFPNGTFFANAEDPLKSLDDLITRIWSIPTVDAVEVVHGRWIETEEGTICSECNEHPFEDGEYAIANYKANYCPNCGARMDGGVENGC